MEKIRIMKNDLNTYIHKKILFARFKDLCPVCGHFPFVRTGRSDRPVRKWNGSVLRTDRTGSGRIGPVHLRRTSQFSRSCADYARNAREF